MLNFLHSSSEPGTYVCVYSTDHVYRLVTLEGSGG